MHRNQGFNGTSSTGNPRRYSDMIEYERSDLISTTFKVYQLLKNIEKMILSDTTLTGSYQSFYIMTYTRFYIGSDLSHSILSEYLLGFPVEDVPLKP
ncbi:hypothetical protein Tco_0896991 [Tanacetum coccineum]